MHKDSQNRYKIEWIIFFLLWITYAYFYQASQHNENARFDQIRAVIEKWQLNIDPFAFNSADIIRYDNNLLYPNKAPGTTYVGIPFFFLAKIFFGIFTFPEWMKYHFICYITTVFTINLISAFCGVCIYWLLLRMSKNVFLSVFITFSYTLGTIAFPFATLYFSHQLAASLVFICYYAVFAVIDDFDKKKKSSQRYDYLRLIGGALAGGFAFVTEYPTLIAIAAIELYALIMMLKRKMAVKWFTFSVFLAIGMAPLFIYNMKAFGKIWYVPYEAYTKAGTTTFEEHKKGFVGVQLPWKNPHFMRQMKEITYRPQRGLFYCNPNLILIFPGFIIGLIAAIYRRKRILDVLMSLGIFVSFMMFNASYGDTILFWGGGYSIGPRHIVPMLPFLIIPLYYFAEIRFLRPFFYILTLISIFFSLAATAIEPRVPFEYYNPVTHLHIPFYLNAKLALCNTGVFSSNFMTENSVAFNIGKLIRLHPNIQLLPLFIFWFAMFLRLTHYINHKIRYINLEIEKEESELREKAIEEFETKRRHEAEKAMPSEKEANFTPFAFTKPDDPQKSADYSSDESCGEPASQSTALPLNHNTQPSSNLAEQTHSQPIESAQPPQQTPPLENQPSESQTSSSSELSDQNSLSANDGNSPEPEAPNQQEISYPKLPTLPRHQRFSPFLTLSVVFLYILAMAAAPGVYSYINKKKFEKGTGLVGKYFQSPDCTGEIKILRKDPVIDFDWNVGPPLPGTFSVQWEGKINIEKAGAYTFATESDDASWLWINGQLLVDNSGEHMRMIKQGSVFLPVGKHSILIKFANYRYGAGMRLLWVPPGEHLQLVPPEVLNSPPQPYEIKRY